MERKLEGIHKSIFGDLRDLFSLFRSICHRLIIGRDIAFVRWIKCGLKMSPFLIKWRFAKTRPAQIPAFLFDNDGVLINSSPFHWKSWQLLMKEYPEFSMTETQFLNSFGKRNDLILKEIVPLLSEEKRKFLAQRKEQLFREVAKGNITLLPGVEKFLKEVKEANIPRIIASSTPPENLKMFLETTVLGNYFDKYVSGEEVPRGKPAPDVFIEAAKRLHYHTRECVVFEDAPSGIRAAKRAGAYAIALATTHKKGELSGYDLLFPSFESLELEDVLSEWKLRNKNKVVRYILGILSIALGIFGFFVPIIPGFLFILLGLYLLNVRWLKKKLRDLKAKMALRKKK